MSVAFWDEIHKKKYSAADWVDRPSMFAELAVTYFPETGSVLELGTGQGNDAEFFHSRGHNVVAVDFSERALEDAQKRAPEVEFLRLDIAEGLPFKDKKFDVVYSHMALHYFDKEKTRKIFKDIHRVLTDSGLFAALVNTIEDPEIQEEGYVELEPEFYQDPRNIKKRYFSVDSMKQFTEGLFEPIVLDNKGITYKDDIDTLIRFIGRKI